MPCTDFYQKRELVGVVLTRVLPDARLLVRAPAIAPLLFTPSGGRRDHMRAPHSPPRGRTFMASEASVHLPCFARARARSKPAAGPLNESASLDCGSMRPCYISARKNQSVVLTSSETNLPGILHARPGKATGKQQLAARDKTLRKHDSTLRKHAPIKEARMDY